MNNDDFLIVKNDSAEAFFTRYVLREGNRRWDECFGWGGSTFDLRHGLLKIGTIIEFQFEENTSITKHEVTTKSLYKVEAYDSMMDKLKPMRDDENT